MYQYYSLAADWAEPLLLDSVLRLGRKHEVGVDVRSYKYWGQYRRWMRESRDPVIFSTHGISTAESKEDEWEFSSLRRSDEGRADWLKVSEHFSAEHPFETNLLIVFACYADELDWQNYLREGAFAIVSVGDLTTSDCAAALQGFWRNVPRLEEFDLTYDNLVNAWPDLVHFNVVPGKLPAKQQPR